MGLIPNFSDVFDLNIRTIVQNAFAEAPVAGEAYHNIESSDRDREIESEVTGFGALTAKGEGVDVTYDVAYQRFDVTFRHTTYGLGFKVSREYMDDDSRHRTVLGWSAALGRSARATRATTLANTLNRAFNTGFLGGDGSALCVTTHALVSGTASNRLATDADLSPSALNEARYRMMTTVDDRGLVLNIVPVRLIVAPAGEMLAHEIVRSTQKSGTSDNDTNFLANQFQIVVDPYLTDDDAWFIQAQEHYLKVFDRTPLQIESAPDFDSKGVKYTAYHRYSVGFSGWRGIFGTSGG